MEWSYGLGACKMFCTTKNQWAILSAIHLGNGWANGSGASQLLYMVGAAQNVVFLLRALRGLVVVLCNKVLCF